MGYSMGARITAFLALRHPGAGPLASSSAGSASSWSTASACPESIAEALEAPSLADVTDPMARTFRAFAEQTKIRPPRARRLHPRLAPGRDAARSAPIAAPALVAVGTKDDVAGSPHELAALMPGRAPFDIPGRDHMLAVGDKVFKEAVLRS